LENNKAYVASSGGFMPLNYGEAYKQKQVNDYLLKTPTKLNCLVRFSAKKRRKLILFGLIKTLVANKNVTQQYRVTINLSVRTYNPKM
jgi:hypothetical protein